MKKSLCTFSWIAATAIGAMANAQTTTTMEDGPDGVRYQVTRQTVQRSIPTTEYQTREQKVYHPQITTEYQPYAQTYLTPVTEYQYVPHLRNWWNPFTGAYWTHDLEPYTRWEARPSVVHVPVSRTNWVEETRTTTVPVTTYRTVPEEYTSRVAVSASPAGTSVASRPIGGQQIQSDPPRTGTWRLFASTARRTIFVATKSSAFVAGDFATCSPRTTLWSVSRRPRAFRNARRPWLRASDQSARERRACRED
jgi:hypothetical protein